MQIPVRDRLVIVEYSVRVVSFVRYKMLIDEKDDGGGGRII